MKKRTFILTFAFAAMLSFGMTSCRTVHTIHSEDVLVNDEEHIGQWVNCRTCNGKGACTRCNGTGQRSGNDCTACNGTGKCSSCNGKGGYRR